MFADQNTTFWLWPPKKIKPISIVYWWIATIFAGTRPTSSAWETQALSPWLPTKESKCEHKRCSEPLPPFTTWNFVHSQSHTI